VKKQLIEIVKNTITFPFWKSLDRSITICRDFQNLAWFAIKKSKKIV